MRRDIIFGNSPSSAELSELHRKLEAQMIGSEATKKKSTMKRSAYARQGHVARQQTAQTQESGHRRALESVSANTNVPPSRRDQLIAYQNKKKRHSHGKDKVTARSKVHAHIKSKKTLVVAGGITRKDRYSDIYGHRQKLAAKQMR